MISLNPGSLGGISCQQYCQTWLNIVEISSAERGRIIPIFQYVISLLVIFVFLSLLYSLVHAIIVSARTESKSIDKVLVAPKDIELNNDSLLRMIIYLFIVVCDQGKKMEALVIAIYQSTGVLRFARTLDGFSFCLRGGPIRLPDDRAR
jgi:hypothetical protein